MSPYDVDHPFDCDERCCDAVVFQTEPCGCTRNQYGDYLGQCTPHEQEVIQHAVDSDWRARELAAGWDPTP
jgi:hypothetical protein